MLSEELGCSPTLSVLLGRPNADFYFDPLGLATDDNFARMREAELKHGRIAMAANVGVVFPPAFRWLLSLKDQELLGPFKGLIPPIDTAASVSNELPSASIRENLAAMTIGDYLNILITCFFLENFVFFQREAGAMPGDYGTGYFSVRDKGINERSLVVELENGRLAMLAVLGQVAAELVSGKSWLEQWESIIEEAVASA